MDLQSRGEAPYIISGLVAILLFIVINMIGGAMDPNWSFDRNCLSDLGVSKDPVTSFLFSLSCFICGILLIVFAIGKYMFEDDLNVSASVFLIGACIGIFGVALFGSSGDTTALHNVMAGTFAGCVSVCVVLITVSDILHKNYLVLVSGLVIGIVAVSTLFTAPQNMSEFITVGCVVAWFIVQLYKYYRQGMFSKAPAEA